MENCIWGITIFKPLAFSDFLDQYFTNVYNYALIAFMK